jgi:hypothetical protein
MRWTLMILALACATPAAARDHHYVNARFGFSVDYPADLVPQPESDNGDGRRFLTPNYPFVALAWGAYNAENETLAQLAKEAESDCSAPPVYQRIAATFFAMSCRSANQVIYEKMLLKGGTETALRIEYPAVANARWAPVVARMSASLRGAG